MTKSLPNLFAGLLICCVIQAIAEKPDPISFKMQRLLGLSIEKTRPRTELLRRSEEGDVVLEDMRFLAEGETWVPAIVVKPLAATQPLPAIICLPGTSGTRQELTDDRLRLSERPRTGWARALARSGFITISLDYRGSETRQQNIYTDALREQLEGRSQMGLLVYETIRAVDYLLTRPDVEKTKIGITGFSLGGAVSWYAAAADPRISVIVPVCGGAGTYDALLRSQQNARYHSQYFYPAGFLKHFPGDQPQVFASFAPRALLVVGRDRDQGMPIEGLRKLEQVVKSRYADRNAADRFAVYITAGEHTYTDDMFEHVSGWFRKFLIDETGEKKIRNKRKIK
jgi:dienelactone hydrolase